MEQTNEKKEITGTVTAVIFRNEENGYTVLRLDTEAQGEVTLVGCMPGVTPGETLQAEGNWMKHASYGEQFKIETLRRRMPVGEAAVFEYLASRTIKGIGARTAKLIVDQFGAHALEVIEREPERLTQVKGFSPKRAQEVHEAFLQQAGMRLLLEFLGEYQLPLSLAMPLYRRFGNAAIDVVRENPYLLTEWEMGMDFSVADNLAIEMGMDGNDPQRVEAGLLFELRHNLNNGHTFLPRHKLLAATGQLLNLDDNSPEQALDGLIEQGEIVQEQIAGQLACYLSQLYAAECYTSFRLDEMSRTEMIPPHDLDRLLQRIQREQGISYAPEQEEAVRLAACRQVLLLTGGPGTGKSATRFCVK